MRLAEIKEIIALIIHHDEGWKIFDFYFPDGFHAKLWIFQNFFFFYLFPRPLGSHSTNSTMLKTAMFSPRITNNARPVALGEHYH